MTENWPKSTAFSLAWIGPFFLNSTPRSCVLLQPKVVSIDQTKWGLNIKILQNKAHISIPYKRLLVVRGQFK